MTLQEYLVKLGWSIDEPSFKRFVGAIASTSAQTAELASTVIETAGAVEAMVSRVARKYETLYYMGQRNSQSIRYIQSTQFAFRQIGLSAEEANANIESMGHTLRTQPWLKAIFGGASTPQEVANKLGKSGLPYFLQARFAEMIGMDEKTLLHLQKFGQIEAEARADIIRKQREAGVDPEQLANQSKDLGRELVKLEGSLEVFGDRVAQDLIGPTKQTVIWLTQATDWLNRVNQATNGWVGTLTALGGTAAGIAVVEKIVRRLFGATPTTFVGRLLLGGGVFPALAAIGTSFWGASEANKKYGALFQPSTFAGDENNKTFDYMGKTVDKMTGANKTQYVIDQAMKAGFPKEAAIGIASGLFSESNLNPQNRNKDSNMFGIGQWDTARRAQFAKLYGKDIHGSSFEEQVAFALWELSNTEKATGDMLRKGGMSGRQSAAAFIHGFERPGLEGERSDMSRAGPLADRLSAGDTGSPGTGSTGTVVNLHSNTKVVVQGGGSIFDNANAYKDAHDSVMDGQVRNLQTVLR